MVDHYPGNEEERQLPPNFNEITDLTGQEVGPAPADYRGFAEKTDDPTDAGIVPVNVPAEKPVSPPLFADIDFDSLRAHKPHLGYPDPPLTQQLRQPLRRIDFGQRNDIYNFPEETPLDYGKTLRDLPPPENYEERLPAGNEIPMDSTLLNYLPEAAQEHGPYRKLNFLAHPVVDGEVVGDNALLPELGPAASNEQDPTHNPDEGDN